MANKHGSLSINSDNIFPVIKKWLYSDHDIFFRELISNGCDAITKLKKLDMMGEYSLPNDFKAKIEIEVNPEEKTLTFTDNGLGMTADEAREKLMTIKGVGEKVANCVLLFGLGFTDAFPVDVWMKRIMEYMYFNQDTKKEVIECFAYEKFGKYAGYAQQYLFHYGRENGLGK